MSEDTLKFVQIIEKLTCLYKQTLAEYSRKKTRTDIALEINW